MSRSLARQPGASRGSLDRRIGAQASAARSGPFRAERQAIVGENELRTRTDARRRRQDHLGLRSKAAVPPGPRQPEGQQDHGASGFRPHFGPGRQFSGRSSPPSPIVPCEHPLKTRCIRLSPVGTKIPRNRLKYISLSRRRMEQEHACAGSECRDTPARQGAGRRTSQRSSISASATIFLLQVAGEDTKSRRTQGRGRSSGVEHNLAKVRVVSSNLIARSIQKGTGNGALLCFPAIRSVRTLSAAGSADPAVEIAVWTMAQRHAFLDPSSPGPAAE